MKKTLPVATAIGLATALALGAPAEATSLVTISQGHIDAVDVAYEAGALELSIHDETVTPDVERDPADVIMRVKRNAKISVPSGPEFAFLGAPGAKVWVLPEIQDPNLLWPGLAADEVPTGTFTNDAIDLNFSSFSGPDGVSIFTNGPTGAPQVLVDSEDSLPDVVNLSAGSHSHANWAFEKAGTYRITVTATGVLASTGQTVTSDPAVLTFKVIR